MKLSLRGEYALRAMLVLGLNYDQQVVRIQTISDQQNIPKRFLEQILNDLKSGGMVQSKRGVAGGYRLARRPEQITLASIVLVVIAKAIAITVAPIIGLIVLVVAIIIAFIVVLLAFRISAAIYRFFRGGAPAAQASAGAVAFGGEAPRGLND